MASGSGDVVNDSEQHYHYIIVGGGIAGVSCAETLSQLCKDEPAHKILLLSATPVVKAVTNFRKVTKTLEEFDVEERPLFDFAAGCANVVVKQQSLSSLNTENRLLQTSDGSTYRYSKLCLCTGGSPKIIAEDNENVIGIRDIETVKVFQKKLVNARRIIIIGNGGIANELVFEIEGCEVVWAIKDNFVNSTFVDEGASVFLLPQLHQKTPVSKIPKKRTKYVVNETSGNSSDSKTTIGGALGPDWHDGLQLHGKQDARDVHLEYSVEVERLLTGAEVATRGLTPDEITSFIKNTELNLQQTLEDKQQQTEDREWPIYVQLTNGKLYGCDFVISATGIFPNTEALLKDTNFMVNKDKRLVVDMNMQTNIEDVYAAGDVCSPGWELSTYWIQMCLWSQARQMGIQAARSMMARLNKQEDVPLDFCFEMFAHVTKFFNYKVVLLGKFNAQGLGTDHNLIIRCTPGVEYIKVVMKDGRMHGAVLIGDTDLEETFENLILNQMDLSAFGEDILNPNIDIEDFFD